MVRVTSAGAAWAEQRGGEQVEGLAGALRPEHAGGAVVAAPQLDAAGVGGPAQPPPDRRPASNRSSRRVTAVAAASGSAVEVGSDDRPGARAAARRRARAAASARVAMPRAGVAGPPIAGETDHATRMTVAQQEQSRRPPTTT